MTDKAGNHPGGVFTGDTLFIAGCGRFFEGTGAEMHAALSYLGTLPNETVVYDGHEYTKSNLAFAKSVDPANPALGRLERLIREGVVPAERTTIGDEKEWNPFMRLDSPPIQCVWFSFAGIVEASYGYRGGWTAICATGFPGCSSTC